MRTHTLALAIGLVFSAAVPIAAQAQNPITDQEALAIGMDAYVYFYPLLSMDLTRKQFTNVAQGQDHFKGPMNTIVNVSEYPPGDFKGVVRSNFDTLYSSSWLDLSREPVVLSVPDTNGRYYLMPMLDMWTDVFASPGWRQQERKPEPSLLRHPIGGPTCATGSSRN